jgi:hypothetical protein
MPYAEWKKLKAKLEDTRETLELTRRGIREEHPTDAVLRALVTAACEVADETIDALHAVARQSARLGGRGHHTPIETDYLRTLVPAFEAEASLQHLMDAIERERAHTSERQADREELLTRIVETMRRSYAAVAAEHGSLDADEGADEPATDGSP